MSLGYEPNEETVSLLRYNRCYLYCLLRLTVRCLELGLLRSYIRYLQETQFFSDCRLSHAPPQRRDSLFNARWLTSNKNGGPGENRTPNFCVQGRSYPI